MTLTGSPILPNTWQAMRNRETKSRDQRRRRGKARLTSDAGLGENLLAAAPRNIPAHTKLQLKPQPRTYHLNQKLADDGAMGGKLKGALEKWSTAGEAGSSRRRALGRARPPSSSRERCQSVLGTTSREGEREGVGSALAERRDERHGGEAEDVERVEMGGSSARSREKEGGDGVLQSMGMRSGWQLCRSVRKRKRISVRKNPGVMAS